MILNFDFHVHSSSSFDSLLTPKKIIRCAHLRGLDAIAVTDHNTIEGGLRAQSIEQDSVMVIVGSEVNTNFGDLIGLFLNEEIVSRTFYEVIDEIKDQDGIVFLPHPYRRKIILNDEHLKNVDILEGINGRTSEELNLSAQRLSEQLKKPMIAGSDAHFSFELGKVWNTLSGHGYDEEELKKKVLNEHIEIHDNRGHTIIYKTSIVLGAIVRKIKR